MKKDAIIWYLRTTLFLVLFATLLFTNIEAKSLSQKEQNAIAAKVIPIITTLLLNDDTQALAKPKLLTKIPTEVDSDTLTIEIAGKAGSDVYANGIKVGTIGKSGKTTIQLHLNAGENTITLILQDKEGHKSDALRFTVNYPIKISGYVMLDSPVSGATVEVYDTNGNLLLKEENATDESGYFELSILKNNDEFIFKAFGGQLNDLYFKGTVSSLCKNKNNGLCYITPYTSMLQYFSQGLDEDNKTKIASKTIYELLKINEFPYINKNTNDINLIKDVINKDGSNLLWFIQTLYEDGIDGYLDNNIFIEKFANAKTRPSQEAKLAFNPNKLSNYKEGMELSQAMGEIENQYWIKAQKNFSLYKLNPLNNLHLNHLKPKKW